MSIGELINLYRDDELDIHPEFQRFYRWTDEQKSRLIESILLGIPLPSIFVSQRADGVWDVVDGLQRLSTIFELVGILKDVEGTQLPPLVLRKTKYLPSMEGKKWDDDDPSLAIGSTNQLIIRRSKIDVKIILRESSESSKYELFQRLNTAGSQLSDQEIRNVVLMMVNPGAYEWISELSNDERFQECIALSDRAKQEQYDMELVTRFLVFRSIEEDDLNSIGDIGEFLTDKITELAQDSRFDEFKETEEYAFRQTFSLLASTLSERSFHRFDVTKAKHLGGFLISAFEPIALGIGHNIDRYATGKTPNIEQAVSELWRSEQFQRNSGGGVRASTRVRSNIPLGRQLFAA